ncbi:MAG: N-acetylmuramoyl-L-alanine amidase family protein [Dorea sp.]
MQRQDSLLFLDPGTAGGYDPGAIANGTNEKTLTLKIAKYCKDALEKNGRIQVYMTRESDTSVGGATNASADLKNRVSFAVSKNADLAL